MEVARLKEVFGIDARALSIFRIFIGLILFFDLFVRVFAFTAHYTDFGVMPLSFYFNTYAQESWWSIHTLSSSVYYQIFLFSISFIFSIFLILGYQTKLSTIMSWVLLISLHSRNPAVLQGGDVMLRVLLFWAMFLPLNIRYSLDSKFRNVKSDKIVLSFGSAGILLQVCFVYFFSALLKTGNDWFPDGTAIYYALQLDQFATHIGKFVLNFYDLMIWMTHFVYFTELIGPFLLFIPIFFNKIRIGTCFAFFAVLIGMALSMRLGHFPFIGIAAFVLFLPTAFWDKLSTKIKLLNRKEDYRIYSTNNKSYSTAINLIALFFIIYVLLWNIQSLGKINAVPDGLDFIAHKTRLDQYWNMFSPFPLKEDGWYIIEGTLENNEKIDLRTEKPVNYTKPEYVASLYPHERWRKYLMNLWDRSFAHHRYYYLKYICYDWNNDEEIRLEHIKMTFMLEMSLPNYKESEIKPTVLEEIDCNL